MTEQSLPKALAIAYYCTSRGFIQLKAKDFKKVFPDLHRPGLNSSNYYVIEECGLKMLGAFMVDRGGAAHRIKSKVRKFIRQRESLPQFTALIAQERAQITVLTGFEGQRRVVKRYLGGDSFLNIRVRVELVPELGDLLTIN